jgi:hypothetical protein
MKIEIEDLRLEVSVKNGLTATLVYNFFNKHFIVLEVYNLCLKDIRIVEDICKNDGMAIIKKDDPKFGGLAKFKVSYSPKAQITFIDRLTGEDIEFYDEGTVYNVPGSNNCGFGTITKDAYFKAMKSQFRSPGISRIERD